MTDITECLQKRYGRCGRAGERIVVHIDELWDEFISIADPGVSRLLEKRLCSEDWNTFHQGYWELLLARRLRVCGLSPQAMFLKGPDFRTTWDSLTIWIEAVAPSQGSEQILVPSGEIPSSNGGQRVSWCQADHKAILRRWTGALQEKHQKLLGYLDQGIVTLEQAYVIAINSCLLPSLDALHGPSGLPWLAEALFGAGQLNVTFDRQTLEYVSEHHDFRESVLSKKGSAIPTAIFLDERYPPLSAVLATVALPDTVDPYVIVAHNPLAHNKVPLGILGASEEWVVDDLQPGHVKLKRLT